MKKNKNFFFTWVLCTLFLVLLQENTFAQYTSETIYQCAPCGCDSDDKHFDKPGNCPSCGMKLEAVTKPFSSLKNLDEPMNVAITDEIHLFVESLPEFKDGQDAFLKFAQANLSYPEQAKRMGIEGRVFVKVVIEKDGSISNAEVVKGIGGGCGEEALKLFRISPKWIPAKQRGRPVRVSVTFPIKFTLT